MFNKQIIKNILWLFIDKVFLLIGAFAISIIVARYLGPVDMGKLSFGIALSGLPLVVSQWGGNHLIFNVSAKNNKRGALLIKATENARLFIYILVWIFITVWLLVDGKRNSADSWFISFVVLSYLFLGLDVYQYYFNATLKSKSNAIGSILSKVTSLFVRIFLVIFGAKLWAFVFPIIIECGLSFLYKKVSLKSTKKRIRTKEKYNKLYFHEGVMLMFSGLCVFLYTKINEIMLVNIKSFEDLGYFSISLTIGAAWTFIPMSIGVSLLSSPLKLPDEETERKIKGFSGTLFYMVLISCPVLCVIYFFSKEIVLYTLGKDYIESSKLLFVVSLASLTSTLGFITNRIISSHKSGSKYLLKKVMFLSFASLIIGYVLINEYGAIGAAYNLLIIEFMNFSIASYYFRDGLILKIHKDFFNVIKFCNARN